MKGLRSCEAKIYVAETNKILKPKHIHLYRGERRDKGRT